MIRICTSSPVHSFHRDRHASFSAFSFPPRSGHGQLATSAALQHQIAQHTSFTSASDPQVHGTIAHRLHHPGLVATSAGPLPASSSIAPGQSSRPRSAPPGAPCLAGLIPAHRTCASSKPPCPPLHSTAKHQPPPSALLRILLHTNQLPLCTSAPNRFQELLLDLRVKKGKG
ncbi:hypothetical protein Taro_053115 [Colocasia esculenta]|uniref:Uncharacterized protein n=1 Tax=Colocasia esculenta TaxID=4460 RepID=A0A843XLN8_COLES|nr:hypothetical protein [Colocasia esculenta]